MPEPEPMTRLKTAPTNPITTKIQILPIHHVASLETLDLLGGELARPARATRTRRVSEGYGPARVSALGFLTGGRPPSTRAAAASKSASDAPSHRKLGALLVVIVAMLYVLYSMQHDVWNFQVHLIQLFFYVLYFVVDLHLVQMYNLLNNHHYRITKSIHIDSLSKWIIKIKDLFFFELEVY